MGSWGSAGAEAASSGAGNAASSAANYGAAYSNTAVPSFTEMSIQSGPITSSTGGFSIGNTPPTASGMGPTVQNASDLTSGASNTYNTQVANMREYGTATPSIWQKSIKGLDNFESGRNNSLGGFIRDFGNNAKTYGYGSAVLEKMAALGKGGGQMPIPQIPSATISTTDNDYLRKYRRY